MRYWLNRIHNAQTTQWKVPAKNHVHKGYWSTVQTLYDIIKDTFWKTQKTKQICTITQLTKNSRTMYTYVYIASRSRKLLLNRMSHLHKGKNLAILAVYCIFVTSFTKPNMYGMVHNLWMNHYFLLAGTPIICTLYEWPKTKNQVAEWVMFAHQFW